MASGSARTSSGPAAWMVIRWWGLGQAGGHGGLVGQRGRIDQRRPGHGRLSVRDGGDQELLEQPLQLGALTAGHGEQFLLLGGGQGRAALVDGGQGA